MRRDSRTYNDRMRSLDDVREFVREFFVYGLRTKEEFTNISPRTYDEWTRRMLDWFSEECFHSRVVELRKNLKYLSFDCRAYAENPLYKCWKASTFKTNHLIYYFSLINSLSASDETVDRWFIYKEAAAFIYDSDAASRKMLGDLFIPKGLIKKKNRGKYTLYPPIGYSKLHDALSFFSEIAPVGVIGSFILDKCSSEESVLRFKQHFVGQCFDSEILCNTLYAIKRNRNVKIIYSPKNTKQEIVDKEFIDTEKVYNLRTISTQVFPVTIFSSTQTGRQYLIAWSDKETRFFNYRVDGIKEIEILGNPSFDCNAVKSEFNDMRKHIWGVSQGNGTITHVEFIIKVDKDEKFIIRRLEREKRCGEILPVEGYPELIKFSADVYDAKEMLPWIRTFICRIVELHISDKYVEDKFWRDLDEMYEQYLTEGIYK